MSLRCSMRPIALLALIGCLACWGCTEAGGATEGGGGGGGGGASGAGGGGASGGSSGAAGTSGSAGSAAAGGSGFDAGACSLSDASGSGLVVNEISAQGDDYVELYNTGSDPVDLSGRVLADFDDATGCPKTDEALTFPTGTQLGPDQYLLVVAGQTGATNDPSTDCLAGPATCFHVSFGISAGNGDAVFVLDGSSIEAYGAFPANAVDKGESLCRVPDGTGDWTNCSPTPGTANAAP